MNQRKLRMGSGGLAAVILALIVWPFIGRAQRPAQWSFKIATSYSQIATIESAFNLSSMTRDFVVSEGPCAGDGCNGGILSQQPTDDASRLITGLQSYNDQTQSVIWLYQIKPIEVTRRYDLFGEDSAVITGTATKDQKIYLAVVPKRLVEPPLQWVYVETK